MSTTCVPWLLVVPKNGMVEGMERERREGRQTRILEESVERILLCMKNLGWRAVGGELSRLTRAGRVFHSTERRWLMDALHDMVRGYRRLGELLENPRPSAQQLVQAWLHPERYATRSKQLESAYLQTIEANAWGAWLSYPTWLVQKLLTYYGADITRAVLETQNQRGPITLRVNQYKVTREQVKQALQDKGIVSQETTHAPWGLQLTGWTNVNALPGFTEGWFEVQDEGSQLIAELVSARPGEVVVDACAGAGGKTLALGAEMQNKGRLWALDNDAGKLQELGRRIRRAGLTNVEAKQANMAQVTHLPSWAHRVLCDVPCSGLGVLRRQPEARWMISPAALEALLPVQTHIVHHASQFVAPSGILVYATCTLLMEENEQQIERFLRDHPSFSLVPVHELWEHSRAQAVGDGTFLKLLPTQPNGPDGFFAAVLQKNKY